MIDHSDNIEAAMKVANRFERLTAAGTARADRYKRYVFIRDLLAADGCNGNLPIRWDALLSSGNGDFIYDAAGIYMHINRETGRLDNGFAPRFAS